MDMPYMLKKSRQYLWALMMAVVALNVQAQTEDDFLPQVRLLAMDSSVAATDRFCKAVLTSIPEYRHAFTDKEDIYFWNYVFDNDVNEKLKMEFQFAAEEYMQPDSTMAKRRVVILQRITAELSAMTKVYNYIFNTTFTPDKIIAISRNEKAIGYHGTAYNSTLVADDYRPGYWVLTFFRL